jgi:hypothetical protein
MDLAGLQVPEGEVLEAFAWMWAIMSLRAKAKAKNSACRQRPAQTGNPAHGRSPVASGKPHAYWPMLSYRNVTAFTRACKPSSMLFRVLLPDS